MGYQSSSCLSLIVCVASSALVACSDTAECVSVTAACAPLYEPTFENVFQNTLQPRCGVAGVACHAREGAQGGLALADIDDAYQALVDSRVDSDNLGCGLFLTRLHSSLAGPQMPPSAPLGDAELCSITQWVAQGAVR